MVEHEGEVVGFVLGQFDTESGAELNGIHVLPERQGTGAGRALMDVAVDAFRGWGVADARGLTTEQLALRSVPPSELSLLGLVRHLS